jgi:hypothetical protein
VLEDEHQQPEGGADREQVEHHRREGTSGAGSPAIREQHIDDLAMLIDRPI